MITASLVLEATINGISSELALLTVDHEYEIDDADFEFENVQHQNNATIRRLSNYSKKLEKNIKTLEALNEEMAGTLPGVRRKIRNLRRLNRRLSENNARLLWYKEMYTRIVQEEEAVEKKNKIESGWKKEEIKAEGYYGSEEDNGDEEGEEEEENRYAYSAVETSEEEEEYGGSAEVDRENKEGSAEIGQFGEGMHGDFDEIGKLEEENGGFANHDEGVLGRSGKENYGRSEKERGGFEEGEREGTEEEGKVERSEEECGIPPKGHGGYNSKEQEYERSEEEKSGGFGAEFGRVGGGHGRFKEQGKVERSEEECGVPPKEHGSNSKEQEYERSEEEYRDVETKEEEEEIEGSQEEDKDWKMDAKLTTKLCIYCKFKFPEHPKRTHRVLPNGHIICEKCAEELSEEENGASLIGSNRPISRFSYRETMIG